jgi:hypothetical protein
MNARESENYLAISRSSSASKSVDSLSLSISNSFPVYVHAVFHFASPLEIHNLYFGKHNKGVANFHR